MKQVKKMFDSPKLLDRYRSKPIQLSCDVSLYGIGAVLAQSSPDRQQKPLAFASQSLMPAERKYAQLDNLMHIFGEYRGVPAMASARIQRWAILLGGYDYVIQYKP